MGKLWGVIGLLVVAAAVSSKAQTTYSAVNGACTLGGQAVVTQGLGSSGTQPLQSGGRTFPGTGVMASYPGCTVTVYNTGSLVPASIYLSTAGGQLSNPFTANLTDGTFVFFAPQGCYDIMISSGATQASAMPNSKTFPGVCAGVGSGGGGTGSGTSVTINGTAAIPNALNFTSSLLPPPNSTMVTWLLNGNTVSGYVPSGGSGGSVTVNGATGGTDLNDRLPAQPPNGLNISWSAANGHISGALIGDGIATHCLLGTGVFAICPGGGSGGGSAGLPSTTDVLAGNGTGGAVATGVSAASGHVSAQVLRSTGATSPSPFSGPSGTMEYFPTGGYGIGTANGVAIHFSHSASTAGATGNGGLALGGGNATGANYQIYLDCEHAGCDFKVPITYNGAAIGGGGGGATLPATTTLLAGDGAGGAVATGVNAASGFVEAQVVTATGATNPSPFTPPNASVEYFPSGAYGIATANGATFLFSHSGVSGSAGNGAVVLAGGNISGVGTSFQPYLACQMSGCDFKVAPTYNGASIGGTGTGSGTVNAGTANQFAYYQTSGTAVSSNPRLTDSGTTLTYSGAGHFTGNLTIDGLLQVAGPWLVNSVIPSSPMGAAPTGQSSWGISNNGNFYISANAGAPSEICTAANGACSTGAGTQTWPSAAGIPNYNGASGWGTTYNASNLIPGNFMSAPTGTGFFHTTAGVRDAASTTLGTGLAITAGALTTVGQQPYEIAVTVNSTFTASQVFLRKPTSLAYTIPAGCTNSQIMLGTATTAALTIMLSKNGTSFGTAVIAAGTTGGSTNTTWTCSAATSFVVGTDVLTITAPATADTTAANFGGSFYATR